MPYGTGTYGSKVGRPKKSMLSDDRESYGAGAIVRKGIQAVKRTSDMKSLKKDIAEGLKLDDTYNAQLKELRSKNASDAKIKELRENMISNIEDVALMQDMLKQLDEGVSSKGTQGKSKFGLDEDRSEFSTGAIVKKSYKALKKKYEDHVKRVAEDYGDEFKISNAPSQTREVTPEEAKQILKVVNNYEIPFGGTEGTLDRLFEYELEMVAAGKKPQKLNHWWFAVDDSTDDYVNSLTPDEGLFLALDFSKNSQRPAAKELAREQKSAGGILTKLFKLAKKEKPKKVKEQDIDRILDNLSDEQMEKLSPIEIEQLLDMDLAKSGVDNIPTKSTKKDIDKILGGLTDKEMENLSDIEIEQLLDMDLEKYGRKGKMRGGLLDDDRQTYGAGAIVKKLLKRKPSKDTKKIKKLEKDMDSDLSYYRKLEDDYDMAIKDAKKSGASKEDIEKIDSTYLHYFKLFDDNIDTLADELEELGIKVSKKNLKERQRFTPGESGDFKKPLKPLNKGGMLSDNDMEENYTRFIMDEALSEEEEDMLVTKLEQDKELQMLFDKVIDVAQEFAGNGPVEGPGTGVSDDIPARLSDGEFVFTAKAVEEIGEDNLMSMMKEAEAAADGRQGLAEGMMVNQKPQSMLSQTGIIQEDEAGQGITEDMRKEVTKNIYS